MVLAKEVGANRVPSPRGGARRRGLVAITHRGRFGIRFTLVDQGAQRQRAGCRGTLSSLWSEGRFPQETEISAFGLRGRRGGLRSRAPLFLKDGRGGFRRRAGRGSLWPSTGRVDISPTLSNHRGPGAGNCLDNHRFTIRAPRINGRGAAKSSALAARPHLWGSGEMSI